MKKRVLSSLLAALLLLTTSFAAETGGAAQNQTANQLLLQAALPENYDTTRLENDMNTAMTQMKERLTAQGYTEYTVERTGDTTLTVTLPEGVDPAGLEPLLTATAKLTFVDADDKVWLTGADIAKATASYGFPTGSEIVSIHYVELEFTEEGTKKFAEATESIAARAEDEKNVLFIQMDDKTVSSPSVNQKIESNRAVISGSFTAEDAKELAALINVGQLPFALRPVASDGAAQPDEPAPPAEPAKPAFPDIAGHWAEPQLTRAYELGLLKGSEGKMMPDQMVKRVEALVILNRALGTSLTADISGLTNVPANAWYRNDLAKARYIGLIDGKDSRSFEIGATRAEAFVLLARAFVYERAETDLAVLSAFTDADGMTAEQKNAAAALIAAGIVKGDTATTLAPNAKLTRAQFVTMLLRIVPNFPAENEDLSMLSGGALITAPAADLTSLDPDGDRVFACPTSSVSLSGVNAGGRMVLRGAEGMQFTASASSLPTIAVDEEGYASLALSEDSEAGTLLLAGDGGAVDFSGNAKNVEITATGRTIHLYSIDADTLIVSGAGNTVVMDGDVASVRIAHTALNTKLTLNGKVGDMVVAGRGSKVDGKGKAESIDTQAVDCEVTLAAASKTETIDHGLDGVKIEMGVPAAVKAGGSLVTQVKFSGVTENKVCSAQWYQDGKPIEGFSNDSFNLTADTVSRHTSYFTFTKDMKKNVTMGFKLTYYNPSTGETEQVSAEKTVPIENYSDEWYYQRDVDRVLKLVSSTYNGNYTAKYAINGDYQPYEKEVFVNAKGYSSNSNYLIWINRAYQHVNVFTGSKGNWKLHKSFLVGTGASSSPTPTGLTTVSYKSAGGWTTSTYTVKPVVGFYPGTGYAFHSRLYYPGTTTISDSSIGYPISHGCVRMYDQDVQWIYNNIPVGTTVAIF